MGNWGRGKVAVWECVGTYILLKLNSHEHTRMLRLGGRLAQHPGAGDDRLALATRLVRLLHQLVRGRGLAVRTHLLLARLRARARDGLVARDGVDLALALLVGDLRPLDHVGRGVLARAEEVGKGVAVHAAEEVDKVRDGEVERQLGVAVRHVGDLRVLVHVLEAGAQVRTAPDLLLVHGVGVVVRLFLALLGVVAVVVRVPQLELLVEVWPARLARLLVRGPTVLFDVMLAVIDARLALEPLVLRERVQRLEEGKILLNVGNGVAIGMLYGAAPFSRLAVEAGLLGLGLLGAQADVGAGLQTGDRLDVAQVFSDAVFGDARHGRFIAVGSG